MTRGHILFIFAMLMALLIVPGGAVLAECEDPSLEDALAGTSVVFIGEVTDTQFDSDETTIRVLWIWKGGDLAEVVEVSTPGAATFSFRVGATYIVIPQDTTAPFELAQCSGTRMYRADGETIPAELQDVMGSATGRAPGTALGEPAGDSSGAKRLILAGVSAGLLGFLVVGVYRFRSRSESRPTRPHRLRRGGGPLAWSARSGGRQLHRMRRGSEPRRRDSSD